MPGLDFTESLNRRKAAESQAALAELRRRSEQVNVQLMRDLDAARRHTDPDLSPTGLENRRREMAEQAREKATTALEGLQGEQRQHAARIREWAEAKRPTVGDDPVQLQKMSMAWDRARAMLDAGRSIPQVLASATDPAMVLALREWGPDYLRAAAPARPGMDGLREEPDYSALARSADDRLAELHGGDVKAALGMLRDLGVTETAGEAWGQASEQVNAGHDPMQAAVQAHYAEQMAGAGWQDHGDSADSGPAGDAA